MGSSDTRAKDASFIALSVERTITKLTTLGAILNPKVAVFQKVPKVAGPAFALIQNILSNVEKASKKDGFGLQCVESKIKTFMNEKEFEEWDARLSAYRVNLKEIKDALIRIQPTDRREIVTENQKEEWLNKWLGESEKRHQETIWNRIRHVIFDMKGYAGMYMFICRNTSIPTLHTFGCFKKIFIFEFSNFPHLNCKIKGKKL